MAQLTRFLALVQPVAIFIENVVGLMQHPHYRLITQVWNQLGLRVVLHHTLRTNGHLPTDRPRYLGVLLRADTNVPHDVLRAMQQIRFPRAVENEHAVPLSFILPTLPANWRSLQPTPTQILRLSDPELSVGGASLTPEAVLGRRMITQSSKQVTIMASYRQSVHYDYQYLRHRKLLVSLVTVSGVVRFLHPVEIAACLGIPIALARTSFQLPLDSKVDSGFMTISCAPDFLVVHDADLDTDILHLCLSDSENQDVADSFSILEFQPSGQARDLFVVMHPSGILILRKVILPPHEEAATEMDRTLCYHYLGSTPLLFRRFWPPCHMDRPRK